MGQILDALLHLQSIERQLAHLRGRLRSRENAVATQQRRIQQLEDDYNALNERSLEKRKEGDRQELELRSREEHVARLRTNLNTARTNKEYAAILTQINSLKADNSKLEEAALRIMQEADAVKADANKIHEQIESEQQRLEDIRRTSTEEVAKLTSMMEELGAKRAEAAGAVPPRALARSRGLFYNYARRRRDGAPDSIATRCVHESTSPPDRGRPPVDHRRRIRGL